MKKLLFRNKKTSPLGRLFLMMLALAMLMSLSMTAFAEGDDVVVADNSQTAEELYLQENELDDGEIDDTAELLAFAQGVNDGTITTSGTTWYLDGDADLENDLASGETWPGIGNADYPFAGTFEGKMTNNNEYSTVILDGASLFNYVTGTIQNIIVEGTVTSTSSVGALVTVLDGGTVDNCTNRATINVTGTDVTYTGGLIGSGSGTITNCGNEGNISSTATYVGGIVGHFSGSSSTISTSANSANVVANASDAYAGGIVGHFTGSSIFECSNSSNIEGTSAGGIVGYTTIALEDCSNSGTVNGVASGGSDMNPDTGSTGSDTDDSDDVVDTTEPEELIFDVAEDTYIEQEVSAGDIFTLPTIEVDLESGERAVIAWNIEVKDDTTEMTYSIRYNISGTFYVRSNATLTITPVTE